MKTSESEKYDLSSVLAIFTWKMAPAAATQRKAYEKYYMLTICHSVNPRKSACGMNQEQQKSKMYVFSYFVIIFTQKKAPAAAIRATKFNKPILHSNGLSNQAKLTIQTLIKIKINWKSGKKGLL